MTDQITPTDAKAALALLAAMPPESLPYGALATLTVMVDQYADLARQRDDLLASNNALLDRSRRADVDLEYANRNTAEVRSLADMLTGQNAELRHQLAEQRDSTYQGRVAEWMMTCFGPDITNSLAELCFRFFEEAGELCQALGMTQQQALDLVAYTWGREKGEPSQEVGGVMVTLAAMCHAAGLDMAADGETELARINTPETIDKIRRKHHAKTLRTPHSALPGEA